jgi:WXG100 family type VII secretion target
MWGANLHQLNDLAADLHGKSTELNSQVKRLKKKVAATGWSGPDADRFRQEWESKFEPSLRKISEDLDQASRDVRRSGSSQQRASS